MFIIQTQTKKGWRKLKDATFSTYERADAYGMKYWTDKHGAKFYRVVEI